MPAPVVIVDYDPAWPIVFAGLSARLAEALGGTALSIEHVGSTAVPGLAAKPIIDLDIVIVSETVLPDAICKLAAVGYAYEGGRGLAGRHAFSPPSGLPKHHPYVCACDNAELGRHLAFRDHLRRHPADSEAYGRLKRALAERFRDDRDGYTNAKTAFVEDVLRRAR